MLDVRPTGKPGSYGEHPLVGRSLPNGWYIVIADSCDDRIVHRKTLAQLSAGGQVVACSIEEHVMASSCAFWEGGKKKWSVEHQGERGVFDIKTSGKVPESYSLLKEQLVREQKVEGGEKAEVDLLFDLPLNLAKQYSDFKHDEDAGDAVDNTYEVLDVGLLQKLSRTMAAAKPWLIILFVLVVVGVLMAAAGELTRWVINYVTRLLH